MMGGREGVRELEKQLERIMETLEENRRVEYSRRWVRVQEVTCPRQVGSGEGLEGGRTGNRKHQERSVLLSSAAASSLAGRPVLAKY